MHRRHRHRPLILLIALAALVTGLAAPASVAAAEPRARAGAEILPKQGPDRSTAVINPVPDGTIGIRAEVAYLYNDGSIAVVAEVLNNTTSRRQSINVIVRYFESVGSQTELGTFSDTVLLDTVASGTIGPIEAYDPEPPVNTGAYRLEIVSSSATSAKQAGALDVEAGASTVVPPERFYPGQIRNPNPFTVTGLRVVLVAYDSTGDLLDVRHVDAPSDLAPGGTYDYELSVPSDLSISRIAIRADAVRSGQPTQLVTSWANYFDDLKGSSFRDDIAWLAQSGITVGCGVALYCPTRDVRRDEMASFLSRALDLTGTPPDAFVDDDGNTHELNIDRIADEGITAGCNPAQKLYCPAASVRRDEMASFLVRALGLTGTPPDAFTDDDGNTHELNINRAAAAGLTTGCTPTTYCPSQFVSRGQMAAFLRRAFD